MCCNFLGPIRKRRTKILLRSPKRVEPSHGIRQKLCMIIFFYILLIKRGAGGGGPTTKSPLPPWTPPNLQCREVEPTPYSHYSICIDSVPDWIPWMDKHYNSSLKNCIFLIYKNKKYKHLSEYHTTHTKSGIL